jgi:hypothetical protein
VLTVENRGAGFIGSTGNNWRVALNTSPVTAGQGPGRLGAVSFSAPCDATTKFTIDNYVSVKHYLDDQTTRRLATFDGYIRSVETDGDYGTFGIVSRLSALDVRRVASVDVSGFFHRKIELPTEKAYVVNGITYYTGGEYVNISGVSTFVRKDITIYDIAARNDFVYVLASGMHNGEIIFQFYSDGQFLGIIPVYSDATDTSNPGGQVIAVSASAIFVGQNTARRVKRFNLDGTYHSQFGASGSADGQFQSITGIAASSFFNSVFVVDGTLGRVQRFNYTGVYQNKWGTPGTGTGNTVFNSPGRIAIDPVSESVFVADLNARIRAYDSFGNIQTTLGSYDFDFGRSDGEYVAGQTIGIAFDSKGAAYGFQGGLFTKHVRTTNQTSTMWFYGNTVSKQWYAEPDPPSPTYVNAIGGDETAGQVYIARTTNYIEQYGGTLDSLAAVIEYYVALAVHDFPIRLLSINRPLAYGDYAYRGWDDNVWSMLCELCAATNNSMAIMEDSLLFFNRTDRTYHLPDDLAMTPLSLDSRASGQRVEVVNQNSRWSNNLEVMYDAAQDNNRVLSIDVLGLSYSTIDINMYPDFILQPIAADTVGPGAYTVVDSNELPVSAELWNSHGAKVTAILGERPGSLAIRLDGPMLTIPGTVPPYRLTDTRGTPTLTVMGSGVVTNPEVIRVGTGASEEIAPQIVAQSIDSPFLINSALAYTEGAWAAYHAGTPNQRFSMTFSANESPDWAYDTSGAGGTFQLTNAIMLYQDSEYLIENVEFTESTITVNVVRYNLVGHTDNSNILGVPNARFDEIWNGRTCAEFEAYWNIYTSQDFTIAPLRNPYGFNSAGVQ